MSTADRMKRTTEASPRFKARIAGIVYFVSVLTAVLGESAFHGSLSYAAGLIAVSGMIAVTLLFIDLSASDSGRADGVCRFGLDDLSLTAARKISIPRD